MKKRSEIGSDERIIDLIRNKLEERNEINFYNYYRYQIIELWVNKVIK